jgi:hypothetical protein
MRQGIDHHTIAELALSGMGLDMLGGLYLAYDLLGQRQGLLRFLQRVALYSLIFGAVYGAFFGTAMALWAGITLGAALSYELADNQWACSPQRRKIQLLGLAIFRSVGIGVGFGLVFHISLGVWYVPLSAIALSLAYSIGYAPIDEQEQAGRPHLSLKKIRGSIIRATFLCIAASLAAYLSADGHDYLGLILRVAAAVGIVGVLAGTLSPLIEGMTDSMPARTLGYIGVALILAGILCQSVQYWVVLLDVPVR